MDLLVRGFLRAAEDVDTRQYVRIGEPWITDDRGRKKLVVPRSLELDDLVYHLRARAYKHVSEAVGIPCPVRGRPNPVRGRSNDDVDDGGDPLANVVRPLEAGARNGAASLRLQREAQRAVRLLETFDAKSSPRQRAILELTAQGYSTHEIAEALRIADSTVRVHRHRHLHRKGIR